MLRSMRAPYFALDTSAKFMAMEEYDELSDETPDSPEEQAPPVTDPGAIAYWQKRAERAEKQAVERRVALRRFEVAAQHGVPAEKIPEWVPADKLEEFVGLLPKDTPPTVEPPVEAEPQETPQAEVSEEDRTLAAVAKGSTGAGSPAIGLSQDELLQVAMNDPSRYEQLKKAGLSLEKLPGSTR